LNTRVYRLEDPEKASEGLAMIGAFLVPLGPDHPFNLGALRTPITNVWAALRQKFI